MEGCGVPWSIVFAFYSVVAVGSVVWMQLYVLDYNTTASQQHVGSMCVTLDSAVESLRLGFEFQLREKTWN